MDERRIARHRSLRVRQRHQRFVLDLDQLDRPRGDLGRHGRDGGDHIGLEADLLLGEQAAVLDQLTVEHVGHVLVREHREHAGQRLGLGCVDRHDPRPGVPRV